MKEIIARYFFRFLMAECTSNFGREAPTGKRRRFFGQDSVIWHPMMSFCISNFDLSNSLSAFFVSLPPWGRRTTAVVDEVLEIYTAQTAITSSVTRKGSCHLPHGGRLLRFFALRTGESLRCLLNSPINPNLFISQTSFFPWSLGG